MSAPDDTGVIVLSRWRAALARARRGKRVDALLAEPDARQLVPALPVQELYYLINEVGLADAIDLLKLVSPEQIRGFLDFDVWDRDHLASSKADPWLDALLDIGPAKIASVVNGLDAEVVALLLQRRLRVYDLSLEGPPDEPEGHFYPTPDRFFLLDILGEGDAGRRAERLVDWLYRADLNLARRVLMSARWEIESDLEEWAYRWRSGRMADLGFADYYEALEVYRWLDPATVAVSEGSANPTPRETPERMTTLPAPLADSIGERGFLARSLSTIDDPDEIERLQGALITLVNRVMAAERAEPGDAAAVPGALQRVNAYLSMGLEFLARGDPARGGEALRGVALARVFRVGFSLTLKLKRAADTLVGRRWAALTPEARDALGEEIQGIVAALRLARPLYPLLLDATEGSPPVAPEATRLFQTLADVARAARALERAAAADPTAPP